jgi:hypothetical protein
LGLGIPRPGWCGRLVGDAVAAGAALAHSLAVEVGEVGRLEAHIEKDGNQPFTKIT